ncbi:MAG: ankyrin repeat domain-containing protein [Elusimicrobiota bacterium]
MKRVHWLAIVLALAASGALIVARRTHDAALARQLSKALWAGQTDAVKTLLAQGAELEAAPDALLLKAVGEWNRGAVETLLALGASPAAIQSALDAAAAHGLEELIGVLLAHGAKVDVVGARGRTPLAEAAAFGNPEAVKVLLSAGAEVDVPDKDGNTPLHLAAASNLIKETLGVDVFWADKYFDSATRCKLIKLLLDRGAKATAKNNAGETPLYMSLGDPKAAEFLVAHGANPKDLVKAMGGALRKNLVGVWMDCPAVPDQGCENVYSFENDHQIIWEHHVAHKVDGFEETSAAVKKQVHVVMPPTDGGDWEYVLETTKKGSWELDDTALVLTFKEVISEGASKAVNPPEILRFSLSNLINRDPDALLVNWSQLSMRLTQLVWKKE